MSKTYSFRQAAAYPAIVAAGAVVLIFLAIDPSGVYPNRFDGPGITLDEIFNVREGVRLEIATTPFLLGEISLAEAFGEQDDVPHGSQLGTHLADHPPLGRLWIGICRRLTKSIAPPADADQLLLSIAAARTASALAFGVLVFLIGYIATQWYGRTAGLVAALSVVLMPRAFGHAHLATLETMTSLTYAGAILSVAHLWGKPRFLGPRDDVIRSEENLPSFQLNDRNYELVLPRFKTCVLTGVLFGLALLTKMQAIFIPVPIVLWAWIHWKYRSIWPLLVWGCTGLLVFFAFWPWLWLDPIEHFIEYFGRTSNRLTVHAWYLGFQYDDVEVPWHYPFVMFLITVPLGLQLLGLNALIPGTKIRWQPWREWIVLVAILVPMSVFAIPGIAVYDGVRLFLVVFALWAILIGAGFVSAWEWLTKRVSRPTSIAAATLFFAIQGYGIIMHCPCHLSYYNLAIGGLRGADKLGMEPTYWSDSFTAGFQREVVDSVPEGATIYVAPVLHQFQLNVLFEQSPILRKHNIQLRPFTEPGSEEAEYIMVFYRKADLQLSLRRPGKNIMRLAEVKRQDVPIAALYRRDNSL